MRLTGSGEVATESMGTMWLEDGELRYSKGTLFLSASAYVRFAKSPEGAFEALLHWSNDYIGLREVTPEGSHGVSP